MNFHRILAGTLICFAAFVLSTPPDSLARSKGTQASSGSSGGRGTGLGIILGDPTGLNFKHWLSGDRAFDAGLAYSFGDSVLIYGDYLFHFPGLFGHSTRFVSELNPYLGLGGVLFFATDDCCGKKHFNDSTDTFGMGLRIPGGVEWLPSKVPFGVFVELAPGIGIIPGTFGFLQGGVGGRFYF